MKKTIMFMLMIQVVFLLSACFPTPHGRGPGRAPRAPRHGHAPKPHHPTFEIVTMEDISDR